MTTYGMPIQRPHCSIDNTKEVIVMNRKDAEIFAQLAVDYWKLMRAFDRTRALAGQPHEARLEAQAKYADGRLTSALNAASMRLVSFDGAAYTADLPVSAINADEFPDQAEAGLRVASTLEPAVIQDMTVIRTGRVALEPCDAPAKKE
jgi:hypothetical protein